MKGIRKPILIFCYAAMSLLSEESIAQEQRSIQVVYAEGSTKVIPDKASGELVLSEDGNLTFTHKSGNWKLPSTQIKTIYVSLSRRSALGEVFGVPGAVIGAAKQRKLLLSLAASDESGRNIRTVFELRDQTADFLTALGKKSGRTVVYESDEARRAAAGQR
ncbi:MAG: hypothetical protein HY646_01530 [Acidobacteria bacterium]|nr:hypothetical protein [Acidobacteriota bacterium]